MNNGLESVLIYIFTYACYGMQSMKELGVWSYLLPKTFHQYKN